MDAVLIATIDWTAVSGMTFNILKVALGLGFVIFVHEAGHFLVAKMCGVKCEKFYVGFDIPMPFGLPSKLWHRQWGETEYGIGVLPLGGYVKMLGQDDNPMNAEEEAERTKLKPELAGLDAAPAKVELDPRSYTAKTVPQRMAIISAGVIVNLIFAVIFAAFAFRSGVPFTPCEIGRVVSGSPAWEAGLQPGQRIVQIDDGKKTDKLRFDWDLRQGVAMHDDGSAISLLLRDASATETRIGVRPVTVSFGVGKSLSSIGIGPSTSLKLVVPKVEQSQALIVAAQRATPPLQTDDVITRVDDRDVNSSAEVLRHLIRSVDKPVKLTVKRPSATDESSPTTIDSIVPPQPLRTCGVVMKHGPVTAVQPNSPASLAGVKRGDLLVAVNGEDIGDPMLLPTKLRPLAGKECELTLNRAGEPPIKLKVTPRNPTEFDWEHGNVPNAPMSIESLGLAFEMTFEIAAVMAGSGAETAGLKPGDTLVEMQLSWKDPQSKRPTSELPNSGKPLKFADRHWSWTNVFEDLQALPADQLVALTYHRGNQVGAAKVEPILSGHYRPDRGLIFDTISETHVAESWGEALQLGARQTKEDAGKVFGMVRKLVTGQVALTKLGGLGSIAYVATSEASEGTTRLLIFLTMLSANLAVLNFLPIPALDGGHMMFLLYEGIFRKPVNERIQVALTIAGVACLLGLMLFVNALDVTRFFF